MKKPSSKKTKKAKTKKAQNEGLSSTQKKALKPITREGAKMWVRMNKRDVTTAIGLGQILLEEKKIIVGKDEGKKGVWGRYRTKHYPGLEAKRAQRYMQLAEHVDLEEHPTLAYLGQAKLLRLIQLGDGKTPAETLGDEGVDIEFDVKDASSRKQFQSESADLIKELAAKQRKEKEEEESSSKEPGEKAAKALKTLHELMKQPEELKGFEKRLEEDEDLQAKNKFVRRTLRKLPPEIKKATAKPSARRKGKRNKVSANPDYA